MPGFATRAIRAASRTPDVPQSPINVPIYASSTFEVGSVAAGRVRRPERLPLRGRDVTEQRRSQEMLIAALDKERTAVERLRQLDQAKNEFVSTVCHELRTPVTSIVGYTEMLERRLGRRAAPRRSCRCWRRSTATASG